MTDLEALAAALHGEQAAAYGCGVAGAYLPEKEQARARAELAAHRARRDALAAILAKRGAKVPADSAGYSLPHPVTDANSAQALLAAMADRLAGAYADLVLAADGAQRVAAARWLQECAVRAVGWRGAGVPFPGLPERRPDGSLITPAAPTTSQPS